MQIVRLPGNELQFFIVFSLVLQTDMLNEENREQNKQMDQLQRIRMLETRMRNKGKPQINEQSLRSIKSTDSKKVNTLKNKVIMFEKSIESDDDEEQQKAKLQQVKNNRKITDYFPLRISAKKQQSINPIKQSPKIGNPSDLMPLSLNIELICPNATKSNTSAQQAIREQNKNLKQKLKIKEESFIQFRNKMKKDLLEAVVQVHRLKRNQMRLRVSNNKIRLGEFQVQKKTADVWVDGTEIREIKEKLEAINKEKEEIEKAKKVQWKKAIKDFNEDPEEYKNTLACQLHFLTREETHLQENLKKLEEEKLLHIKEYRLLVDEENSKYGRFDSIIGTTQWPKIGQYQLLGLLGKGGFSEVYKAFDTEELREVAVKLHELAAHWSTQVKENFIKHAMREEVVHKMLNHPNIVKLYGTVEIDQSAFCTILQFCEGPDLSYYLKKHRKIPEKEAKMVIKQVINAIKYLHELPEKVIHYDLKPQNILFHKGKIKITDFGLCKITSADIIELTSQGVGTYWYLPPECFVTDQKAHISTKVDIWSIGVIYFELLYGEKPFGNQMSQTRILSEGIMLKATSVSFPNQPKCLVSNQSKQFIKACLNPKPEQRIDIRTAASHPLFEKR